MEGERRCCYAVSFTAFGALTCLESFLLVRSIGLLHVVDNYGFNRQEYMISL